MQKTEERRLARKIVRTVGQRFRPHGFVHTKPTYIVRPFEHFAHFVHFHKFTFGPEFRVHLGVRVMNDPFDALALNGPSFENADRFGADEESTVACTQQLVALLEMAAIPWFDMLRDTSQLLSSPASPLVDRDRQALIAELAGNHSTSHRLRSTELLGLAA